jgi:succinate dehydrogenase/fumarate reductase flavoprotein subunit
MRDSYDLIVFGSGAAGLVAALVAARQGLNVCICEATDQLGGTTATSGGTIWVPGNQMGQKAPDPDTLEKTREYMKGEIGDIDAEKREAFFEAVPQVLDFLKNHSPLKLTMNHPYPDYHSEEAGAAFSGRALTPLPYDGRRLGAFFKHIRPPMREYMILGGMMVGRSEIPSLVKPWSSLAALKTTTRLVFRYLLDRLFFPRGTRVYLGNALVAALTEGLLKSNVDIFFNTRISALKMNDDHVVGADVSTCSGQSHIKARKGVVLATGGFSSNSEAFLKWTGIAAPWSATFSQNTGDGINAALAIGAKLDRDHASGAFWMPASRLEREDGTVTIYPHIRDRPKPGLICVGQDGRRFVNESASYHDVSQAMLDRLRERPGSRFYLVCDRHFIHEYGLGMINPVWQNLSYYQACGYLFVGDTPADLARRLAIDPNNFCETIERHNNFAQTGSDPDFGKGSTRYNRFNGDSAHKPNPCLGSILKTPFYAVEVRPAPIGTSLGLLTDADGRVLREDGMPISGLYAAGNDMSSIMRGRYPGPGITLGPHIAFAWRSAINAANLNDCA